MSTVIPVILTDNAAQTLTLNPTNVDTGGTSSFRDTSVARNISESLSISVTENSNRQKVRVKRSKPLYTVIDGVAVITGYYRVTIEEEFPLDMDPALRAIEAAKSDSAADNAMIIAARENGEPVWS